jgi:hypothetical protein
MAIDMMGRELALANFQPNGNGHMKYDISELVANAIQTRGEILKKWMDPRRDVDKECGHPETGELTAERYKELYDRFEIAERVVKLLPEECWNVQPQVIEDEDSDEDTEFEKTWKLLGQSINGHSYYQDDKAGNVWSYLKRVDTLSGIGHFGVLLMGFDDGKNLQEPVEGAMTYNSLVRNYNPKGINQYTVGDTVKFKDRETQEEKQGIVTEKKGVGLRIRTADMGIYDRKTHEVTKVPFKPTANRQPMMPDCFMTVEEERTLRNLPNLNSQEEMIINQMVQQREVVLNTRSLMATNAQTNPKATGKKPKGKQASGYSGLRQGDIKAPGVVGTDQQYDAMYGALSPYNPLGSLAGTDQQYFGVQFGASEQPSDKPSGKELNLLFLRPFEESLVQVVRYEWNVRNPRFGSPVMYRITLNDPREQHSGIGLPMATVFVHWSRVIHVADNLNSSEIFGVPRMRPVMNRLLDLIKVYGGDSEGYWRGCIPGLSLETHPQLGGDVTVDMADVRRQVENFYNGLQRALGFTGMSAKTLAPSVVDPSAHVDKQIEAICIAIGCPKRVFLGSERGELASSQDDAKWNDRLMGRQNGHITPHIIVPFIDRLISVGVLPEPKGQGEEGPRQGYSVRWPDLDSTTKSDRARIALTQTQAMQAYVAGNVEAILPLQDYYVKILGLTKEEAQAIIEGAQDVNEGTQAYEDDGSDRMTPEPASPEPPDPDEEQGSEDSSKDQSSEDNSTTEPGEEDAGGVKDK